MDEETKRKLHVEFANHLRDDAEHSRDISYASIMVSLTLQVKRIADILENMQDKGYLMVATTDVRER